MNSIETTQIGSNSSARCPHSACTQLGPKTLNDEIITQGLGCLVVV